MPILPEPAYLQLQNLFLKIQLLHRLQLPPHVQTTTEEITTVTTTESEEDKIKSIASDIKKHIDNNIISANIEMDSDIKKNDIILLAAKTGWRFYDVSGKNENKNIDRI